MAEWMGLEMGLEEGGDRGTGAACLPCWVPPWLPWAVPTSLLTLRRAASHPPHANPHLPSATTPAAGDRGAAKAQYERILGKAALGRGPGEAWAHSDYGWLLFQDGDLRVSTSSDWS